MSNKEECEKKASVQLDRIRNATQCPFCLLDALLDALYTAIKDDDEVVWTPA